MIRLSQVMNEKRFFLEFNVAESGILLRDFLQSKGISKRTLTAVKYDGGKLLVNHTEKTVRHTLTKGDTVTVQFPLEAPSEGLQPQQGHLSIVYEDETILVLDKPAGQCTIPSREQPAGTIANFIAGKFLKEMLPSTVHVVTRLDRDTSGLLCVAKNRHIHHLLNEQMRTTGFQRNYCAFVQGVIDWEHLIIEQPIGRKDGSIIERTVREDGQYSRTDAQVTGRYVQNGEAYTAVSLVLHTGRTHQIRVHMKWAGHPLVGDDLYGGTKSLLMRQALHCSSIGFRHPITNEQLVFESALPADLNTLTKKEFELGLNTKVCSC